MKLTRISQWVKYDMGWEATCEWIKICGLRKTNFCPIVCGIIEDPHHTIILKKSYNERNKLLDLFHQWVDQSEVPKYLSYILWISLTHCDIGKYFTLINNWYNWTYLEEKTAEDPRMTIHNIFRIYKMAVSLKLPYLVQWVSKSRN